MSIPDPLTKCSPAPASLDSLHMPLLLLIPLMAFLLLALLGAAGLYALVQIPRRWNEARIAAKSPPRLSNDAPLSDDLLRYPRELSDLEAKLVGSLTEVEAQRAHLDRQRAALDQKEGRTELARRYADDAALLTRRTAGMRRVLGLVWKARALLTLRAHLATTARACPKLPELPNAEAPGVDLALAAQRYAEAAALVRAFVATVASRAVDVEGALPKAPLDADVPEEALAEIRTEQTRIRASYKEQHETMDRLADTLGWLSDHCQTRKVARGAPAELASAARGEALVDEVQRAVSGLAELAETGDRKMADTAVQNLAEDISQLERTGLEAQAEADAALEVARLLEQF